MKLLIIFAIAYLANAVTIKDGNIPYQVGISTSKGIWCGGVLIDNKSVLVAANCVRGAKDVTVYLGSSIRALAKVKHIVHNENIILHPDIAIVKIPHTPFSDYIASVKLPAYESSYPSYVGEKVIASAWYKSPIPDKNIGQELRHITLDVISNEECAKSFTSNLPETIICVTINGKRHIPAGNGGGPLVLESTKELVGLSSPDSGVSRDGHAAMSIRVTSFLDWIRAQTGHM